MTRVQIKPFFTLHDIISPGEFNLDDGDKTMGALMKQLSSRNGAKLRKVVNSETGEVTFFRIVLNGRHCTDVKTELHDGDVIEFYPAMAGG
ncbi:MAG: MoaD family protein [Deltaproteobacteria bacterium]|nr:MoaD family protein [Deltaproteobacteria bacterium]